MGLAAARVDCKAHNLACGIDAVPVQQVQRRVGRNEAVEIGHHSVLPEERPDVSVPIVGNAGDLASVVNAKGSAYDVSGQRAQVGQHPLLPEECVLVLVAGDVRGADHLSVVADGEGTVIERPTQVPKINGQTAALSPE